MSFYAEDLAHVHDAGFTGFVRGALPALAALLAEHGVRAGRVLDLGCGSGVWAASLAAAGYDVWGLDRSPALLPAGEFVVGSYFDVELPAARAVTSIGECFNYVARDDESLPALLGLVRDALPAGGLLVFDMALPGRVGAEPRRGHVRADDWVVLFEAAERGDDLVREITVFRRVADAWRRSDETHRLRLLPAEDILALLDGAGFDARALDAYGEQVPDGYGAFVATRR